MTDGDCTTCPYHKGMANKKKGVRIPCHHGKCTRPGGVCKPSSMFEAAAKSTDTDNSEDESMSKRTMSMLKSTTPKTEDHDDEPISLQLMRQEPPDYVSPLNATEKKRLGELEQVISHSIDQFLDVIFAFKEIGDLQLHRLTHATLAEYANDVWDLDRRTIRRYISAANVVDNIKQIAYNNGTHGSQNYPIPQNERQARVLSKYSPEKQVELWEASLESAENGRITAAHIKKTAYQIKLEKEKKAVHKARQAAPAVRMSDGFRAAYMAFFDAINVERESNYKNTDMQEVLRALRAVTAAIEVEL